MDMEINFFQKVEPDPDLQPDSVITFYSFC